MKAAHTIKVDGKWFSFGQETAAFDRTETKETKEKMLDGISKSKINRLSTSELKKLAADEGISDALEKKGGELKKILISHFGL